MNFKFGKSFLATALALGALLSGIAGTAGMPAAQAATRKPATKTALKATSKPKAKRATKATSKPKAKRATKAKSK
jgi:Na+/H+-translocating membrane pyrophosphatase